MEEIKLFDTESIKEEKSNKTSKICSDFDDDCVGCDHVSCFLGNSVIPIADGICPFLHKTN